MYLWNLTWWSYWLGSLCSFQLSVESHMVVILLLLLRTCNLRPQALLSSSLVAKVRGKKKRKRRFLAKEFIIVVELDERWLMWRDGQSPNIDTKKHPLNCPWTQRDSYTLTLCLLCAGQCHWGSKNVTIPLKIISSILLQTSRFKCFTAFFKNIPFLLSFVLLRWNFLESSFP